MTRLPPLTILSALALSACTDGLTPYDGNPDTVIATGVDKGFDWGVLGNGRAAFAYDPDACQNWIIDDGLEGYSSPRYDPVSGLPVCNTDYPPVTVIGDYQSRTEGLPDYVPGPGRRTVVRRP